MQRVSSLGLRQALLANKSFPSDVCRLSCISVQAATDNINQNGSNQVFLRHFSATSNLHTPKVDPKKDYFAVLGVTPTCSTSKVKAAFFRLSKIHHPDINKSEEAAQKFHELSEAHEILTNKRLRLQYEEGRRMHTQGGIHRGMRSQNYKHYNATGPLQKDTDGNYNHDEWMDKHYSTLFAKSQKQREKFQHDIYQQDVERKALMKKEGIMIFPTGFKVTYGNAAVAAGTVLAAIYLIVNIATDTDV